jgi:riboflavin kinase / FMN adenylyltransferase
MRSERSPYNAGDSICGGPRTHDMQVFHGNPAPVARRPCALSIGNFDGIHQGHRALLQRVVAEARQRSLIAAAMTFEPHPREFFSPSQAPVRIANLRDKICGLTVAGIEHVYVQHFTRRFASLSPEQFIDQILVRGCQVRWLLVGDDFRFGARRAGDYELMRRCGEAGGFLVERMASVQDESGRVSSSRIRAALQAGDIPAASRLLGHRYAISGRVAHGSKLGRQLGFPTLNLRIAHRRPAVHGIFAVRVHGVGDRPWPAVASVGIRPTIDDSGRWLLEAHLFEYSGDVYGRIVSVEFVQKLRDEERFASVSELTRAIEADAVRARAILEAEMCGTR